VYTTKNLDSTSNKEKLKTDNESNYKNIKNNVDNLKVIQVGITLANENGEYPEDVSTWQFNFKFDLE
jgi:CCR4-NOT transcription complex subunit 7/8